MSDHEELMRGAAAKRLLQERVFDEALNGLKADLLQKIAESNPADPAGREDSYRLHRCVGMLRDKLEAFAGAAEFLTKRNEINRQS